MTRSIGRAIWRLGIVAALAMAAPAHGQGMDAARAFTQELYDGYRTGEPDYLGRAPEKTFAPHLLALIRQDQASAPPGEVGILDGDPICDCQDAGGMRMTRLVVEPAGPSRARAKVRLRFPDETRSLTLDLQAIRGHWRVADVHTPDTPSLVGLLEAGLRERANLPAHPGEGRDPN